MQILMSVLKVSLDAASSVITPLEALNAHVLMDTDWLLMEKFAMVCTYNVGNFSLSTSNNWTPIGLQLLQELDLSLKYS